MEKNKKKFESPRVHKISFSDVEVTEVEEKVSGKGTTYYKVKLVDDALNKFSVLTYEKLEKGSLINMSLELKSTEPIDIELLVAKKVRKQ